MKMAFFIPFSRDPALMMQFCDVDDFLRLRDRGVPLLDVRSPAEFAAGHIPGACNLPLLSNEERAVVGTDFAQNGAETALETGLRLLGPQLADKLVLAGQLVSAADLRPAAGQSAGREVLLHCWRGGMRSRAMGWLLDMAGWRVHLLAGGYKRYRAHVRDSLARPATVLVLGGMTGSGKTEVLHALAARGAQVIDLEGLAGHRGSAFGAVGLEGQGRNEMFENRLEASWAGLDLSRPVWVEDEDRRIGNLTVSEAFFPHIATGRLVVLCVPEAQRVERLVRLYTGRGDSAASVSQQHIDDELVAAVLRLERRLGSETARRCVEAIRAGRYAEAVRGTLGYYDRAYERQMSRRRALCAGCFALAGDPAAMAAVLLEQEATLASCAVPILHGCEAEAGQSACRQCSLGFSR